MKYTITTAIDPEKWNIGMFKAMQKAAIQVRNQVLTKQAEQETNKLFNKLKLNGYKNERTNSRI